MKQHVRIFSAVFAAGAVSLAIGWWLPRGPVASPVSVGKAATTTASVLVDFDDGRVTTYADIPVTTDGSVWSLMGELQRTRGLAVDSKDFGGDLGVLVSGIGGVANDTASNRYWHYWVNQRFAQVGVSTYHLSPGDQVMWKYTSDQFVAEIK